MTIVYSEQARNDLHEIYEYIAYTLLSPDNAANTVNRIMETARSLDTMPERYPLYSDEPWQSRGLRFVAIRNYLLFYTADSESQTVSIIRIMYGGRDIARQLESSEL